MDGQDEIRLKSLEIWYESKSRVNNISGIIATLSNGKQSPYF